MVSRQALWFIIGILFPLGQSFGQINVNGTGENIIYNRVTNTIKIENLDSTKIYYAEIGKYKRSQRITIPIYVDSKIEFKEIDEWPWKFRIVNNQFIIDKYTFIGNGILDIHIYDLNRTLVLTSNLDSRRTQNKSFLKVGDALYESGDTITQKQVVDLKSVIVKYSCPWIADSKIFSFMLTIVSHSEAKQWKIEGGLIPSSILEEIRLLKPLNVIYIDNIRRKSLPLNFHYRTKNIVINVKGKS